jgi:hypothetical protein
MTRSILAREAEPIGKDLSPAKLREMGVSVLRELPRPGLVVIARDASVADLASYAEASASLLYCGGMLHRFPREDADGFLAACFRILAPFGTLRIATLDLDEIVHSYLLGWDAAAGVSRTRQLNAALRRPNLQFVYSEEELTGLLAGVGFQDISRFPPGASPHEPFWDLEREGTQSLVLEAKKP